MKKQLYLECGTGISGDMTVAALLDLGASEDKLRKALASLPVKGYEIKISRVKKAGIDCCDFDVVLETENHDHDMAYLFGKDPEAHCSHADADHNHHHHDHDEHEHDHHHDHDHHHHHEHDHHHHDHDHHHHHEHRGLKEILDIIDRADLTDGARALAVKIFNILGRAESKAHGVPVEEIHFHEVGAVDAIVDILSAAVCFDDLGIDEVIIPCLTEGTGSVRCAHGVMPVPVPAVVNIAADENLTLRIADRRGELITPTGAAIAAAVKTKDVLPGRFKIKKIGCGAGKREYEIPSILRAMIIESEGSPSKDAVVRIETQIDDTSGENLGYLSKKLFDAGARDVVYAPVYMKNNRPAYELIIIASPEDVEKLENIVFSETTTIGVRRVLMERTCLRRRIETVETPFGPAEVKICELPDGEERAYPEYRSIEKICEASGKSYQDVYHAVVSACRKK